MILPLKFREDGLFYHLVINYLLMHHGLHELVSRGYIESTPPEQRFTLLEIDDGEATASIKTMMGGDLTSLLGRIELPVSFGEPLPVDTKSLAMAVFSRENVLGSLLAKAACSLLVLAWDSVKGSGASSEPLLQFLRHCRNAASHHGRFRIDPGSAIRPASWRGKQITPELHGYPLMPYREGGTNHPGFLLPGDPILLLHDIENGFPLLHRPAWTSLKNEGPPG